MGAVGHGIPAQRRAPNAEHYRLDDPGPEQQDTRDECDRTEPDRRTTGDKANTGNCECCRDDPEEPRVFDRNFAF
jgi:hypothetical protein